MKKELWNEVDHYFESAYGTTDAKLEATLHASQEAGLPAIAVAPLHGKFLYMLARMIGAKRILEVGTLAGYSAIWMARALPRDGELISLELESANAEVARANIEQAGLASKIEVRVGAAKETMGALAADLDEDFDLVFIDADKESNPDYLGFAIDLTRPGSLIVVDNVVRRGAILESHSDRPDIEGTRRMNEMIGQEPRLCATALQTVGVKGYDGMAILLRQEKR